jgi:hypothetical protein
VLSADPAVRPVVEPDNEGHRPLALAAKPQLGRFPLLEPGDAARRYETVWRAAFSGRKYPPRIRLARKIQRSWLSYAAIEAIYEPQRLPALGQVLRVLALAPRMRGRELRPIVKSVHAVLCADWLIERFDPAILVVRRDPIEVLGSWRWMARQRDGLSERLEYAGHPERILSRAAWTYLRDRYGPPPDTSGGAIGWLAGVLIAELDALAVRTDGAVTIDLDAACADPVRGLQTVSDQLGTSWGRASEAAIRAMDRRNGKGFNSTRESKTVPGYWRAKLPSDELRQMEALLGSIGVGRS